MYGILGMNTKSEASSSGELTIESMVLADEEFADAAELVHEHEVETAAMGQAIVMAERLEDQVILGTEAMANPELVTVATAAYARESMQLALAALGGARSDYEVTTESIQSSPVSSLEVTTEGIKDTAKKIYEAVKNIFKKIGLTIKKLAAKLVVALDGVGKKAEKMLKNIKADSGATASETKLSSKDSSKIMNSLAAVTALKMALSSKGEPNKVLADNMNAIAKFTDDVGSDITKFEEALAGTNKDDKDSDRVTAALAATSFDSVKYQYIKSVSASGGQSGKAPELPGATNIPDASADKLDGVDAEGDIRFYPTYAKGKYIHGVVLYAEKIEDDDKDNVASMANKVKYANARWDITAEDNFPDEDLKVMSKGELETLLKDLKPASKKLKSFSDARMANIDKVMKQIDKVATKKSGLSMFNRLASSEFNKIRMVAAGNYVASIFAMAAVNKADLRKAAIHWSMYNTND